MKKLHVRKGGFTLIELMIVVAIIGILAAIAIPNFLRFQLKAKTSEGKTNLAAIRTSEQSFYSEYGRYVSSQGLGPTAYPGSAKTAFVTTAGLTTLGWAPEGQVYFNYGVNTDVPGTGFFATAMADINANGTPQAWGYYKDPSTGTLAPMAGHTCGAPGTGLATADQVGPCNSSFGQSEF
jgi:type IV pilus assembly protein PilA